MTPDHLLLSHPEVAEALLAEGRAAGAAAERERIRAIEAVAMPGFEALIEAAKRDGRSTSDQVAARMVVVMREGLARTADVLVQRAFAGTAEGTRP